MLLRSFLLSFALQLFRPDESACVGYLALPVSYRGVVDRCVGGGGVA